MNPFGLIPVIILAIIFDVRWAVYYLAVQVIFLLFAKGDIIIAIIWMIAPIYFGIPWWYDLLLFQYLFVECGKHSLLENVRKGEMSFDEAQALRASGENISGVLTLISFIGMIYWFFSK